MAEIEREIQVTEKTEAQFVEFDSFREVEKKLTVVVISDTHVRHRELHIPEGDVLIHCGDFSNDGCYEQVSDFAAWFESHPHPHKLVISGNHDVGLAHKLFAFTAKKDTKSKLKESFRAKKHKQWFKNSTFLNNAAAEIEGVYFYGTEWMRRGSAKIPPETNVLITHEPPKGILDTEGENSFWSEFLLEDVSKLENVWIHMFGHIHASRGFESRDGVWYLNAANQGISKGKKNQDLRPPFVFKI